ncbi:hypothetical protein Btru_016129 [Bulinus truncatus]|nr:hypothetical protein Btru_016129 [Bulinus truncatus]
MFTIRQLVSSTCTSQVACVHLHHLLSDLTELQQPEAKSETCSSKQSQRKREEFGVKSLCRNLSSSFDNACKKNLMDPSIVPSSILDKIQSAIEECLHRHPISKQVHDLKLQPGEIPLDEIRAAIAKHIQFPQKNDKMADYVNYQVKDI